MNIEEIRKEYEKKYPYLPENETSLNDDDYYDLIKTIKTMIFDILKIMEEKRISK